MCEGVRKWLRPCHLGVWAIDLKPETTFQLSFMYDLAVGALARSGRTDEALSAIDLLAGRAADDATLRHELDRARDEVVMSVLRLFGSTDAALRGGRNVRAPATQDAAYVHSLVAESSSVGELMRRSVLGAFRSARALHELSRSGHLLLPAEPLSPTHPPGARSALQEIVICDASAGQAAITRTLLRMTLKRTPAFVTVVTQVALLQACREAHSRLLFLDHAVPGLDVSTVMRELRSRGTGGPTLVACPPAEVELARRRVPHDVVILSRPINRATLGRALSELGLSDG